jgi:hypothetical protein
LNVSITVSQTRDSDALLASEVLPREREEQEGPPTQQSPLGAAKRAYDVDPSRDLRRKLAVRTLGGQVTAGDKLLKRDRDDDEEADDLET